MSKQKTELMSVRILPNTTGNPRGEARRRGSGLRSRCRPVHRPQAHRLRHLGTTCGRAQRHVPGPTVLRQWRTSELRVAASRERGRQRARGDSGRHPRGVQPPARLRPDRNLVAHRAVGLRPSARMSTAAHHPAPIRPGWGRPVPHRELADITRRQRVMRTDDGRRHANRPPNWSHHSTPCRPRARPRARSRCGRRIGCPRPAARRRS